jgi:hypothetical protein
MSWPWEVVERGHELQNPTSAEKIASLAARPDASLAPHGPLERLLERGAVVQRLAVRGDHALERQLEERP